MTISRLAALILLPSVFLSLQAPAQDPAPATTDSRFTWTIGPEVTYLNYREPGIMRETGFMAGAFADSRLTRRPLQYALFASYILGDMDYEADDEVFSIGKLTLTTSGSILNLRGTAGFMFPLLDTQATLSAGFGYRFLEDDVPNAGPLQGYRRQQTYYYLPVTLLAALPLSDGARSEMELEGNCLLQGENKSADQEMTQDSGYGARLAIRYVSSPMGFSLFPNAAYSFEGFAQYWSVDQSNFSNAGWYEPDNTSTAYGIRLGLAF